MVQRIRIDLIIIMKIDLRSFFVCFCNSYAMCNIGWSSEFLLICL